MYVFHQRNVGMALLLTILTCGLYGIYWLICIADEINALEDNRVAASGGMVVLLTILTCGLYQIYFAYMAGKRLYYIQESANIRASDNSIVHVILCIGSYFVPGACLISYAILQNDINKVVEVRSNGF